MDEADGRTAVDELVGDVIGDIKLVSVDVEEDADGAVIG